MAEVGMRVPMPLEPHPQRLRPGARAAARAEMEGAADRREVARQGAEHQKNGECTLIETANEDHRRRLDSALAERTQILGAMASTRDRVHAELKSARQHGRLDTDVADRGLGRANQRMCDATIEAEAWKAKAAEAEEQRRAIWERNEAAQRRHKMGHADRVKQAEEHATQRVDHGERIAQEASWAFEALHQRHVEHVRSQEKHSKNSATMRIRAAELAGQGCLSQVHQARTTAARWHRQAERDVKDAKEEAEGQVARARQELADRHRLCQDTLAQERVCAAEAKRLAAEQKEAQEQARGVHQERLQVQLKMVSDHFAKKAVLPVERAAHAEEINQVYEARNQKVVKLANDRADQEAEEAVHRLERAKVALANLQAKYVSEVNELKRKFGDAKRANLGKVQRAEQRTEEVLNFCKECLDRQAQHSYRVLERSQNVAVTNTAAMQDKVSVLADLAEQRVAMMQRQSAERRKLAVQQHEDLHKHTEDVRERCAKRFSAERETAKEKVRLARERTSANADRAELRACEAAEKRAAARAAFEPVLARCRGAATEARRRGLIGIAEILEPLGPNHAHLLQEELAEAFFARPAAVVAEAAAEVTGVQDGDLSQWVPEGAQEASTDVLNEPLKRPGTQESSGGIGSRTASTALPLGGSLGDIGAVSSPGGAGGQLGDSQAL
mmetsp:Transcript_10353/g.25955  ORF Transcript_10353/g.25955 Transcript_10353/m.25955 type:complete len:673 (+) Transcript_10353:113-2131(+)